MEEKHFESVLNGFISFDNNTTYICNELVT